MSFLNALKSQVAALETPRTVLQDHPRIDTDGFRVLPIAARINPRLPDAQAKRAAAQLRRFQ